MESKLLLADTSSRAWSPVIVLELMQLSLKWIGAFCFLWIDLLKSHHAESRLNVKSSNVESFNFDSNKSLDVKSNNVKSHKVKSVHIETHNVN